MRRAAFVLSWMVVFTAITWLSRSFINAPTGSVSGPFSESRAFDTLTRLEADERPHPAGSPANGLMRDRIIHELTDAGYTPEIQSAIACAPADRNPGCTAVENIVAIHAGTSSGKAVLAASHYDSTPAGAGAGDDGAGVAVMVELARYSATQSTRNDIIFLFSDGEETGLRGAIAFATQHPLMQRVGAMVNVEARGESGPSTMFETGDGNARLIDLYAHAVPRPQANSLTYEVYKRLPNDTDFSVYRRAGVTGFNLAFTGSASRYHSARDTVARLDPRSLQHQGEQAFALTLALANADLASIASGSSRPGKNDASYFDVFGRWLIRWPSAANVPVACIALAGVIGLIIRHRAAFTIRATVWSLAAIVLAPALLFVVGKALSYPLGIWPGAHPLDHPWPWPGRIATLGAAWVIILPLARVLRHRADPRATLLITWLLFAVIAAVVASVVTGASYLILWPVAAFVVIGAVESLVRRDQLAWAGAVGGAMFCFFLIGLTLALEVILGFDLTPYKILVLAPIVVSLLPVIAGSARGGVAWPWWLEAGVTLTVVLGALVAARTPAYTVDHPRGLNFTLHDDGEHALMWQVAFLGATDRAFLASQGFNVVPTPFKQFGVLDIAAHIKPSAIAHLPPPVLAVSGTTSRDGLSVVTASMRTSRSGVGLGIVLPSGSGVRSIRVDGQELLVTRRPTEQPLLLKFWGFVDRDLPLEIAFDPQQPATITLVERAALPDTDDARMLLTSRAATAAPVNQGDSSLVSTRVNLADVRVK